MPKLWMKKKGEAAVEIEGGVPASTAYLEGYRQVDGPDGLRPDDCGCSGEAEEPEEVTEETED